TINDSPGVIQFSAATSTGSEGGANVIITATRTLGAGGTATARYTVTGGSAANGTDYTLAPASGTTFTWNDADALPKTITITIPEDFIAEGTEDAIFTLSNVSGATLGANTVNTLSITEGPGILQFGAPTYTVTEG